MAFGGLQPSQLAPVIPGTQTAPQAPQSLNLQRAPSQEAQQPDFEAALQALETSQPAAAPTDIASTVPSNPPEAANAPDYEGALQALEGADAISKLQPEPSETKNVGGVSGAYGVVELKDGTFGIVHNGKVRDLTEREKHASALIAHNLRVLGPVAGGLIGNMGLAAGPVVGAATTGAGSYVGGEAVDPMAKFFERLAGNKPHERTLGERTLEAVGGAAGGQIAESFLSSGLPATAGAGAKAVTAELAAKAPLANEAPVPVTTAPAVSEPAPATPAPIVASQPIAPVVKLTSKSTPEEFRQAFRKLTQNQRDAYKLEAEKLKLEASDLAKMNRANKGKLLPEQAKAAARAQLNLKLKTVNSALVPSAPIAPSEAPKSADQIAVEDKTASFFSPLSTTPLSSVKKAPSVAPEVAPEVAPTISTALPPKVQALESAPVPATPSKAIQQSAVIAKTLREHLKSVLPSSVDLSGALLSKSLGHNEMAILAVARRAMTKAVSALGNKVIPGSKLAINNAIEVLGRDETIKLISPELQNLILPTVLKQGELPSPEKLKNPYAPEPQSLNEMLNAGTSDRSPASLKYRTVVSPLVRPSAPPEDILKVKVANEPSVETESTASKWPPPELEEPVYNVPKGASHAEISKVATYMAKSMNGGMPQDYIDVGRMVVAKKATGAELDEFEKDRLATYLKYRRDYTKEYRRLSREAGQ